MVTIAEVYVLIILIMPGFITFNIAKRAVFSTIKTSQFEITMWSLIVSIFDLMIFKVIRPFETFEELQSSILSGTNVYLLVGISIVVGVLFYLYRLFSKTQINDNPWSLISKKIKFNDNLVTIFTKDGLEIRGYLSCFGDVKNEKDIIIEKPMQVIRNQKMKASSEISCGKTMIIKESNICRVAFDKLIED